MGKARLSYPERLKGEYQPKPISEEQLLHQTSDAWPTWTGIVTPSPHRANHQIVNGVLVKCH